MPAPDPADLLATARAAIKTELLPALPEDRRYAARMVLNALAIASRQVETGSLRALIAEAVLAPFVPEPAPEPAPDAEHEPAARVLARRLRAEAPGAADPALHAALLRLARAETEESNPRARILTRGVPPAPQG
jgi:hypothetical protein